MAVLLILALGSALGGDSGEESFLPGFRAMAPVLGALPPAPPRSAADERWRETLEEAEALAARRELYPSIASFRSVFSRCCRTMGQIRSCRMDDSGGHDLRIATGRALRDAALPAMAEIMFQEAFVLAQQALSVGVANISASHDVNFELALLHSQRGEVGRATVFYKNALFCDGANVDSLANLGALLLIDGKVSESLHYYHAMLAARHRADVHALLHMLDHAANTPLPPPHVVSRWVVQYVVRSLTMSPPVLSPRELRMLSEVIEDSRTYVSRSMQLQLGRALLEAGLPAFAAKHLLEEDEQLAVRAAVSSWDGSGGSEAAPPSTTTDLLTRLCRELQLPMVHASRKAHNEAWRQLGGALDSLLAEATAVDDSAGDGEGDDEDEGEGDEDEGDEEGGGGAVPAPRPSALHSPVHSPEPALPRLQLPAHLLHAAFGAVPLLALQHHGAVGLLRTFGRLFTELAPSLLLRGGGFGDFGRANAPLLRAEARPGIRPRVAKGGSGGKTDGRIRVGVVSRWFREHTTARLFADLVASLPRDRFEVVAMGFASPADGWSQRVLGAADELTNLPYNHSEAVRRVARAAADVLVFPDLPLDSWTYFIACARLAPVQIATWSHTVTTGLPSVDYFLLADAFVGPFFKHERVPEQVVRIAGLAAVPSDSISGMEGVAVQGESPNATETAAATARFMLSGRHVFAVPAHVAMLHPAFDVVLQRILAADRKAVVVLLSAATLTREIEHQQEAEYGHGVPERYDAHLDHVLQRRLPPVVRNALAQRWKDHKYVQSGCCPPPTSKRAPLAVPPARCGCP